MTLHSDAYNLEMGIFENMRAELFAKMREEGSVVEMITEWFSERKDGSPSTALPQSVPDLDSFMAVSNQVKLVWFGHSTFLLNVSGTIIRIDQLDNSLVTEKWWQPLIGG